MIVIKVAYCSPCKVGKYGVWVKDVLDGQFLDSQCFFFKLTMATNNESVLKKVFDVNPMTQLWVNISLFTIFKLKLLEFIKLTKIACV
jgi:hypothetical protein